MRNSVIVEKLIAYTDKILTYGGMCFQPEPDGRVGEPRG